ncbi:uncharacterized protein LOC133838869 [Drosophila sulfurigaster albostrigata]|uniref:uncharacterized protein LOC133838869 n=1 Tax=Drosophila sulfurigaster albostrigata TaxID=89887 RepID=UPI002D21861E|nr:uncharacterized protein LOC133838869 [Drosophila sulfurigaster albostrigata]
MAQNVPVVGSENEIGSQISTFAVIDLETTNLPQYNQNRVSITEMCIYAFDSAILKDNPTESLELRDDVSPELCQEPPRPPRVLHKLNLLFQPSMAVNPVSEHITGLSNYLLERESKLNENAGQLVLRFIEHLPAPVCLIAHNGWHFDFPIIRKSFDKLNIQFPASLRCVDSLRAFMEIDDKRNEDLCMRKSTKSIVEPESNPSSSKEVDFEARNNKTPERPTLPRDDAIRKRKRLSDGCDDEDIIDLTLDSPVKRTPQKFRSRRQLFEGLKCATTKRIPPQGSYRLGNLFYKTFSRPAIDAHQAEADVQMLTQLVQHYGTDFLAFAEEQSIPFSEVIPLGGTIRNNK